VPLAQALIDAEPVVVDAFRLPPMCRRAVRLGLEPLDRVRVDPDDTVTLVG
jgi:hypothetical protein